MKISNLLPKKCVLCGLISDNLFYTLCSRCEALCQKPLYTHCCQQCCLPCDSFFCGHCLSNPPPFQRTMCSFWYEEPFFKLIHDYKFHQKLFLTPLFGKLMLKTIKEIYKGAPQSDTVKMPEIIIPMPIHSKRLLTRGYHQTHEIAKILAKYLSIPIDLKVCQRIRHTIPQSSLPFSERKKNMQHVFHCHDFHYQHIAIIDDVMTTGESVSALSKTFLEKNPSLKIDVWCLARTKARE